MVGPKFYQRAQAKWLGTVTFMQEALWTSISVPDAERVIVLMGSGVGAAEEAVVALTKRGEKSGC